MRKIIAFATVVLLCLAGCRSDNHGSSVQEFHPEQTVSTSLWNPSPSKPEIVELPPAAAPEIMCIAENPAPWPLEMDQAINIALQNCDVVRTLAGGQVVTNSVTSLDAAIAEQNTKAALAAFDTSFAASFFWNRIDQPPNSFYGPGIPQVGRLDEGGLTGGFTTPWVTGGETRIFYNPPTGYLFFPNGTTGINPTNTANLEFSVRQPLLRGASVDVNRAPIVVSQIKSNQSAWDFKSTMMAFVRSVEQAYWELSAAQIALRGIDDQLPLIEEVVRVEQADLEARRAVPADVAKARASLHAFRQRQQAARLTVMQKDLQLHDLLGAGTNKGGYIIPTTAPPRAPIAIDRKAALATAMDHRPDLVKQRLGIRIHELQMQVAENALLPQFDVQALYRMNGIGEQLGEALSMLGSGTYHDLQFGASFSVPLGRNAAKANVRSAELQLERDRIVLDQSARGVAYELEKIVRQIESVYRQYEESERQVAECQQWLRGARARYQTPPPAGEGRNWLLQNLDDYLEAMRATAEATAESGALLAQYNIELALLDEASGILLDHDGVYLSDDPTQRIRVSRRTENPPQSPTRDQSFPQDDSPPPYFPAQHGAPQA